MHFCSEKAAIYFASKIGYELLFMSVVKPNVRIVVSPQTVCRLYHLYYGES